MGRLDRILAVAGALYVGAVIALALTQYGATETRIFYLVTLLLMAPALAAALRLPTGAPPPRAALPLAAVGGALLLGVAVLPTLEARGYLLALLGWIGLVLGLWLGSHPTARKVLIGCLVLAGAFEALYGMTQSLGGMDRIFDYHRSLGRIATGTFINRNHFAGFLNLTLALGMGLFYAGFARGLRIRQRLSEIWGRAWLVLFACAFVALALLLSQSRGGLLTLVSTLCLLGVLLWMQARERRTGAVPLHAVGVLLILTLGLGVIVGLGAWTERFGERMDVTRPTTWADTLRLIADYPWSGVGAGLFEWRFSAYQSTDTEKWIRHVHNDYLQVAAEWGLPIAVLFWGFLFWRFGRSIRLFLESHNLERQGVSLAGVATLFGILVHSVVDFNLHIPVNLFTFFSIVGVAWAAEWSPPRQGGPPGQAAGQAPGRAAARTAPVVRAALGVAIVLAGLNVRDRMMAQTLLDSRPDAEGLQAALGWDPENPDVHRRLGRGARARLVPEALAEARGHFERALELNPYDRRSLFELARVHDETGELEQAEELLVRAAEGKPPIAGHHWYLANFYLRQGEVEKAREPLRMALKLDGSLLEPAVQILTKLSASAETIVGVWPDGRWARLQLLRGLERRARATGRAPYLELSLETWAALLADSQPLGLHEASFFLQHLLDVGRPEEARRQWDALASTHGLEDPAFTTADNAVWNGSFELALTGGLFDWRVRAPDGGAIERAAGAGRDRSAALLVRFSGSENLHFSGLGQRLVVQPGSSYRLSLEVKPEGLTTDQGPYFDVRAPGVRGPLFESKQLLGSSDWTSHEGVFEVDEGTSVVELILRRNPSRRIDSRLGGSLLLDNVKVEKVSGEEAR